MRKQIILTAILDRVLAALLAVAIGAAAGAAVWRFSPEKPLFTPHEIESGITREATGVAADEVVARLDGNEATAELYTFLFGQICDEIEYNYMVDLSAMWDTEIDKGLTMRDFLHEEAVNRLKQQLVMENLCARYGVTLSAEDEQALADLRTQSIERLGSEEAYLAELHKFGLSEEGYQREARSGYLFQRLYELYGTPGSELYADEDQLRAYAVGAGWVTADHILLATIDLNTRAPLDEDKIAEKRALAEDLLRQLNESEDPIALFAALADEYSEDTGRLANPDGYTFTHGTMVTEFDDAAHELEEGAWSGIVETTYGYHIILRKPLDVEKAVSQVRDEYFSLFFRGEVERAEMELTPALDKLDPVAIYQALREAQNAGKLPEEQAPTYDPGQLYR